MAPALNSRPADLATPAEPLTLDRPFALIRHYAGVAQLPLPAALAAKRALIDGSRKRVAS